MKAKNTYRILSLDGGGIRGLISAAILERLDERINGWRDALDLIAGTSTGGIIALGLAAGHTPSDLVDMYLRAGPEIFRQRCWDYFMNLDNLRRPRYRPDELYRQIDALFSDLRLADLDKRVLINAFDLSADELSTDPDWQPKFFHNFPGEDSDGHRRCADVAKYTSAAPTYFPSRDGFVDGGVVANNPSMAALAQTQDPRIKNFERPDLSQIRLLSIGTGRAPTAIRGMKKRWGLIRWATPLLKIMMDGQVGIPDYQCRQLLGDGYRRLDVSFPPGEGISLDDTGKLEEMLRLVEELSPEIDAVAAWLRKG